IPVGPGSTMPSHLWCKIECMASEPQGQIVGVIGTCSAGGCARPAIRHIELVTARGRVAGGGLCHLAGAAAAAGVLSWLTAVGGVVGGEGGGGGGGCGGKPAGGGRAPPISASSRSRADHRRPAGRLAGGRGRPSCRCGGCG